MAKPGSAEARAIAAGGGVDLSGAALSDAEAQEVQESIELRLGGRCKGCGRRIGIGFKFTSIDPRDDRQVIQMSACTRADCDFALRAKEGATMVEAVEFKWLDAMGLDAPVPAAVVRRNERMAAASAEGGSG